MYLAMDVVPTWQLTGKFLLTAAVVSGNLSSKKLSLLESKKYFVCSTRKVTGPATREKSRGR